MLSRVFLTHPRSVDESYVEHALFAGRFALRLFGAAGAATVHAVIPALFEKTAGNMIAAMYDDIKSRGR
ncbi:DUF6356 family protein [uncultured Tateyamaria sp.]|uniref:DUF6356 family protein n=1 Tax=uncultured Tateyamaria sp. TaxID=455651 RepID=UPI002617274A|nr:DUF6356 family protein [uncultured Tateyamaria sp.]